MNLTALHKAVKGRRTPRHYVSKFAFALALTICMLASAGTYAQRVTMKAQNVTLDEVFRSFKKQTNYYFVYNLQVVRQQKRINVDFKQTALQDALAACLKDAPLEFEIIENTVVIRQRKTNPGNNAAQTEQPLKGRVLDESGKPIPGATILVRGTNVATLSDGAGNFQLRNVPNGAWLVVSSIGYEKREMAVNGRTDMGNISLLTAVENINEVVVTTGLFKRPVENFTGVATSVTGEQMRTVNSMNVFDALKVFDPAMRIPDNVQFGSDPNRLPQISLRGTNNFPVQGASSGIPASGADFMSAYQTNPSMPLFILDGFEVSLQKIYDLDINRIERMTILKDAVATSAYGSRAANGVIVVDTKQPKPGKLTVNYSATLQVTAPDLTPYHLLNAADKLEVERLAGRYVGSTPSFQQEYDEVYSRRRSAVEKGVNTYWLSQPVQTGVGTRQSLYVEGGDQYLRYAVNFGYTNNRGVMIGSGRKTYEGGMMLSYRRKNVLVRNQLTVTGNRSDESPYGAYSQYTRLNPYWTPYDSNGRVQKQLDYLTTPGYGGGTRVANPMYDATLGTRTYSKYFGFTNNTFLEWRLRNGFKFTGKLGIISQSDQSDKFLPADHTSFINIVDYTSQAYLERGSYDKTNGSFFSFDGSATLDYNKNIGDGLFFATVGVGAAEQTSRASGMAVRGFPNTNLDEVFLGNTYLRNSRPNGKNDITRRSSMFSSLNYTYDRRYMADFSFNMDGSTQFGADNRFAPFWALGLGWNLHEEAFMSGLKGTIVDRLRLRGGIGTTGSQTFSPYMATSTYAYITSRDYLGMLGATLLSYGNQNLRWQQTMKKNIGMDVSLLKERVIIRLDAYLETTNDLLLDINTPPSVGVSSYKENIGKLQNRGLEGNINVFLIKNDKQSTFWSVFVNGIHNKNEIKEISNSLQKMNANNDKTDNNLQTKPQLRFEEGQSVNAIWAVRSAGIDPGTGREIFITKKGERTYTWSAADKVIVGDALPTVSGNLGTNVSWKGIQLGVYCSYQYGGKMYNQTLADRVENADLRFNVDERVLLGRWKKPGDITYFKGLSDLDGFPVTSPTLATSRFVQTNNYLEMESLSLGYLVPDKWTARWHFKNTRLNLQMNNLFRLSTIQVERGLDYPFARNINFNITTTF